MKKATSYNTIKTVRDQLGIDQDDLALLLKVSRSYISMAESGRRNLPIKALIIFAQLEKVLNTNSPSKNGQSKELVKKRESGRRELIKRRLAKKNHEIIYVENELNIAREQEDKIIQIADALPGIEKVLGKNDSVVVKHKLALRQKKFNPQRILRLELKLKALQAEIKFLENEI